MERLRLALDHAQAATQRRQNSVVIEPSSPSMPSVRVKRSEADYSVLPEGTVQLQGRPRRGLTGLFQRAQSPERAPPPNNEATQSRPRALTSTSQRAAEKPTSVVHQYCTQGRRGSVTRPRQNSRPLAEVLRPTSPADTSRDKERSPVIRPGSVVSHGHGVSLDLVMEPEDMRGAVGSALSLHTGEGVPPGSTLTEPERHHHDDVVEHLSVIDNHISTVSNLSNVSNTIIIPNLPIYNRRPVVTLPTLAEDDSAEKGKTLKDNLDRHVEDVLTNRRKIRRALSGFWGYITTPMGFVSFVYGFLCAFWGAAIVIFLAKIINLHNEDRQGFWVEISSQIENALFTVTGVGLIPWRVIDTYRIAKIWHYRQVTRRLRRKAKLPALIDGNDLPDPVYNPNYVHVLSDRQQEDLHYQQQKFMASQTWYRPHETETHKAFPIKTALFICLYIDFNSVFQCMLCGCMWSMNRFERPAWTTGTLIPASFLCGIAAGVLIWRGGNQTKKVKEVEERLREALDIESRGVGIGGYTSAHDQPTGEEFAVITRPAEPATSPSHAPTSPSGVGGTLGTAGSVGNAALNAVPTPIGQIANRDPAVLVPAAPQPIISGISPHPGLVDHTPRATSVRSLSSEDGTMEDDGQLTESANSLPKGPQGNHPDENGGASTAPVTPVVGVDKLPLLNQEKR
ncbi:hypothetical protein RSOLAG22IIIB_00750 [Rhizoctonia solani]|uniref:Transmembrane protein n=1 Tax=Rhizoctonia solani TaxID=456999 RepID=A0A0K6FVU0_9AGAM|nr:hypothetical protein RSOLAG22IIIB_00750 [Rhizoctonia solani]